MTEQEKREKAIEGLGRVRAIGQTMLDCLPDTDSLMMYKLIRDTADNALALLKAQEPRVMTLEEVKQERICWIEDADDGMTVRLFPATMFGIGEYANGSKGYMFLAQKPWAIDANDCEWWYLIEDYGEIWRCWTSRPTDEQREETPWQLTRVEMGRK